MRLAGVVAFAVLAAAAVVGCGSSEADAPGPAGQTPDSAASPTRERLAPPVTHPRDANAVVQRPCELLTDEQRAALGFDQPGVQREMVTGTAECVWQDAADTRHVSASVEPEQDRVNGAYRGRAGYPVFEPVEVAGAPGVLTQNIAGGTRCSVVVSLTESRSLAVSFTNQDPDTPMDVCGEALRITEIMVGNLPPLS